MTEENKNQKPQDEKPEQKQKPNDAEAAKPQENKADAKPQEAPSPKEKVAAPQENTLQKEKPKPDIAAEPEKKARPKECSACGKDIQKQWYYREAAYYCGKGCWKKSKKQAQEKTEKGQEEAK
ncbi:MAG: hypothetical protein NG740_06230 [Omnitrophica bacterium]|nr:hypothetical protein [Candidatus Omnitrophota bacterium]